MKLSEVLIVVILGAAAYKSLYADNKPSTSKPVANVDNSYLTALRSPQTTTQSFVCDGRQYCSDMRSYEEAMFFLKNCPDTKMDGDNDGIPCEKQMHANDWSLN